MAAWDFYGKMKRKKLYEFWNGDVSPKENPLTDYTIGIDSIEKMIAKMKERPWPIYKVKVGTADDIAIVKAIERKYRCCFESRCQCSLGCGDSFETNSSIKRTWR